MFNLIVAVLSIALIALTAFATLYYGGDLFGGKKASSVARAQLATLVNNAQQIAGAQKYYAITNSGALATSFATLRDAGFIRDIPELPVQSVTAPWALTADGQMTYIPLSLMRDGQTGTPADRICEIMPRFGGVEYVSAANAAPVALDLDTAEANFACITNPGAPDVASATAVWFAFRN
jgi:hypothetical protein